MTGLDGLADELDHHLLAIELVRHRVLEDVPCQVRVLKYKIKLINSFGRFLYLHILELILLFCSKYRARLITLIYRLFKLFEVLSFEVFTDPEYRDIFGTIFQYSRKSGLLRGMSEVITI